MSCRIIDLFAGAGGLTEGFREAFGAEMLPVWANDNNRAAIETDNMKLGPHSAFSYWDKRTAERN